MSPKKYNVADQTTEITGDQVGKPFSKINIWREASNTHLRCYIDVGERQREHTTTGVAIDGSGSMEPLFGLGAFGQNKVKDVGQAMCSYIAETMDVDSGTVLIYWATNDPGEIQAHGFLTADQAKAYSFSRPKKYGKRTNLLPALKYFVEGSHPKDGKPFQNADYGYFVLITDGHIEDLEAVKQWSTQLAQAIEAGKRKPVKFVMIGLGAEIDENQMIELDNLDTGTSQDLYFHRVAEDMKDLSEIFIEEVSGDVVVAQNGSVKDAKGNVVLSWRDSKVPALFDVDLPGGATSFVLEIETQKFMQALP